MMNLIWKKNNKKGFTLIELIVVIAILGILAAVLIPKFTGFQEKAKQTQALVEAKQWATAADAYLIEKSIEDGDTLDASDTAAIDSTAGTLGTANVSGVESNHVFFTYTTSDGSYSAERGADGQFTLTTNH